MGSGASYPKVAPLYCEVCMKNTQHSIFMKDHFLVREPMARCGECKMNGVSDETSRISLSINEMEYLRELKKKEKISRLTTS